MLFVHCTFEDWMWNYGNIKVYLKTLMLGGINRDSFSKNVRLFSKKKKRLTALLLTNAVKYTWESVGTTLL